MLWLILLAIGALLSFAGFALMIVDVLSERWPEGKGESEVGGVVVIGPVPIVFGTNKRAAIVAALLGAVIMALALLVILLTR